jgi:hypothetical protein
MQYIIPSFILKGLRSLEGIGHSQLHFESSLRCSTAFPASLLFFSKKKTREKRALVSKLCRVRARASSGRREENKDVGRE